MRKYSYLAASDGAPVTKGLRRVKHLMKRTETITIDKPVYGGYGLGRSEGMAVFVPRALPGELVRVGIVSEKRHHAFADLLEVIEPSPSRTAPACPNFGRCGGCDYLHADYQAELSMKRDILIESLKRIGHFSDEAIPDIALIAEERFNYRSIASVKSDTAGKCGFYRSGTHEVEPFPPGGCPLLVKDLASGIARLSDVPPGEIKTAVGFNGILHTSLDNRTVVRESIAGITYERDIRCFFQANRLLRGGLLAAVSDFASLNPDETFADIACGVGFFSLFLAKSAKGGYGYDLDPTGIMWAKHNAALNGIDTVRFFQADASSASPPPTPVDAVIVDPPRTGLEKNARAALKAFNAGRIIYVSCNPSTLARDLADFAAAGYRLTRLALIDMFPATFHMESVTLLVRKN